MYDDGNRLGVFMKENSGQKYFIYNLGLKLEVVDEQFEVARISVKRAIERLPQVENLQRSTSNNMLLYLSITVNTFYNANQVILDLTPVQATKRDLEGRKPIYVVHVAHFVDRRRQFFSTFCTKSPYKILTGLKKKVTGAMIMIDVKAEWLVCNASIGRGSRVVVHIGPFKLKKANSLRLLFYASYSS